MQEYTSTYKLFRELVSIKRAQWTMIWLAATSVALIVGLGCYGAAAVNEQMNAISQSVAAQLHNHAQLTSRIVAKLGAESDSDFYYSLVVRSNNVMIHVNVFSRKHNYQVNDFDFACPASKKYETYLRGLYALSRRPVISNVFLFAGGHGLGKTHASVQLGKALSRFADTVVISVPMNTFGNINDAGALIERIETALQKKCYIVWTFDELDSYVMRNRDDMRDKTITQFAEYTGFINNENRVLVFTMNNPQMFLHNYWADRELIETNLTHYEYADDFRKAVEFTGLNSELFLQEGQLSRLYSFVGNKFFLYKPFNLNTALTFVKQYLKHEGIEYDNATEAALFGDGDADRLFSVRELKIASDDIVNNSDRV